MTAKPTDDELPGAALKVELVAIAADAIDPAFVSSAFGPFRLTASSRGAELPGARASASFDAVLVNADGLADAAIAVDAVASASAVLVVCAEPTPEATLMWLRHGAEDVVDAAELAAPSLARRVRAAIERKRMERGSRSDYATDLATGLPHQQQLVEHMSHLLALREREPAAMAVLVLRIEGFATTASRLGGEAADALRRKIAVRLRGAVRASDVVAAIDDESYAVLLGSLLTPADAERVATKLAEALMEPFSVGGVGVAVAVAVGIGRYPADGDEPGMLLRKAIGMALDEPAQGRVGMVNFDESGGRPASAANDD